MPKEQEEERARARAQFSLRNKKARRWRIFLLPLLAACAVPLLGALWFRGVKPVEQAKDVLAAAPAAEFVTVRLAGDILLAGDIADSILAYGLEFPFRQVAEFLSEADLSLATLETTLADTGAALPGKPDVLRADPSMVESLLYSGLDLLSLASNHMVDYDAPALEQTLGLLDGVSISYIGAGLTESAARAPYVQTTASGLRIAYLAYCENADVFYSYQYPRSLAAKEYEAGVASLQLSLILEDIEQARRTCDVVVLNLHWGDEFSYLPRPDQRELARQLIDGGADVIVGQHPHCLQSVEIYNNGLIVYSLGNLVYAENSSQQTREAAILELELTELGWQSATLYPLLLSLEGQPAFATGEDARAIQERIRSISAGYGATFTAEGDALAISR